MKNEVRPIDANALAKRIREYMDNFPCAGTRLATCRVVLSMLGDEGQTPTLKDHFPEVRKMMPIALDQLKAMNEKVVFVQIVKKDFSSVCDLKSQHGIVKPSEGRIKLFNGRSVFFSSYGAWLAYAYPPAHIDREAWTAEWVDNDKSEEMMCKCSKCGYPMSYFWGKTEFCPGCGRAMTPDALAELEKRMGVRV